MQGAAKEETPQQITNPRRRPTAGGVDLAPFPITYDLQLTTYNLRLTTYDLQLTTYNLKLTTYNLRLTTYNLRLKSIRPPHPTLPNP